MLARRLAVLVALLLGALAVALPADAATPLVRVTASTSPFSPNGDGVKDRAAVGYALARAARVTVTVTSGRTLVQRSVLGRQVRGGHTFTWTGTRAGRMLADGAYRVTIAATRAGTTRRAATTVVLDARYSYRGSATTWISSGSVYPRTTVIRDRVTGTYTPQTDSASNALNRLQVITSTGRILTSSPLSWTSTCPTCDQTWSWDGRDASGTPAPLGSYRLQVVRGTDAAGNPRLLAAPRYVTVSGQQLVARTTTTTYAAGSSDLHRVNPCDYPGGPQDCGAVNDSAGPSSRFPGGLTFRSTPTPDWWTFGPEYKVASETFYLPVAGRGTPSDRFSVTAHGGPTTPDGTDTGSLGAQGNDGLGTVQPVSTTMTGDTSATLSDVAFQGTREPNLDLDATSPYLPGSVAAWSFATRDGNKYDLASFDVTVTRYVLPTS